METKQALRDMLIKDPEEPLPGANVQLFTIVDGVPYWEGKLIRSSDPVPEL
jgi:hypothetical protein